MGNEFCKGCQDNCLSGTLEQDFSNKNKPEENIIYQNNIYFPLGKFIVIGSPL